MSGRLTLASRGIQDKWLTVDPQYSHFLYRYRRHTKFAFEQLEFPFERSQDYGSEMICKIPANAGDLIKGMTLNMDFSPPIPTSDNNADFTLERGITTGSVELNNVSTSELTVYQGVTYTFTSSEEFTVDGVHADDYTYEQDNSIHILTLKIRINIEDDYTSVVIKCVDDNDYAMNLKVKQVRWNRSTPSKMIKYADLLIGGQTIQRITGDYIYMYNQLHYTQNDSDFTLVAASLHNSYPIINDATYSKYTYFQKYKIHMPFFFNKHPSLSIPICGLSKQLVEIKIKFKPINDLTVDYDLITGEYTTSSQIDSDINMRSMGVIGDFVYLTEVEKNFILSRPIEYVITQTQLSDIKFNPGVLERSVMINFKHPVKELFFIAIDNQTKEHIPIEHVTLKFNNHKVIDADNLQLSAEQPLRHHTNSINEDFEFGVYSFSLKPEVHYPTGQVNMSRVIHKLLDVELNSKNVSNSRTLSVYASNYNVLRVAHGIAGLKF